MDGESNQYDLGVPRVMNLDGTIDLICAVCGVSCEVPRHVLAHRTAAGLLKRGCFPTYRAHQSGLKSELLASGDRDTVSDCLQLE